MNPNVSPRLQTHSRRKSKLLVLVLASVCSAAMVAGRIVVMEADTYRWLIVPNLILAWIPLLAAMGTERAWLRRGRFGLAAAVWGAVWLFFYPNASYLFTDLIHLRVMSSKATIHYDVMLSVLCALTGWLLGAYSLQVVQQRVYTVWGVWTARLFACTVLALGALGVYLGRFLRWNSWDLVTQPHRIVADSVRALLEPGSLLFIAMFAGLTVVLQIVFHVFAGPEQADGGTERKGA